MDLSWFLCVWYIVIGILRKMNDELRFPPDVFEWRRCFGNRFVSTAEWSRFSFFQSFRARLKWVWKMLLSISVDVRSPYTASVSLRRPVSLITLRTTIGAIFRLDIADFVIWRQCGRLSLLPFFSVSLFFVFFRSDSTICESSNNWTIINMSSSRYRQWLLLS